MKTVMHFAPKCDANRGRLMADCGRFLWFRNGVYYFKVEMSRVDNKRRYKRISLHTDNYYEALEKSKEYIKMYSKKYNINEFERLLRNVRILESGPRPRLSKKNDIDDINELIRIHDVLTTTKETNSKVTQLLDRFAKIEPCISDFFNNQTISSQPAAPVIPMVRHKISEVLDSWILRGQNCDKENKRKRAEILKMITGVGLTLDDDYSKFHNATTIGKIYKSIVERTDIKNDMKRKYIRYIKNFATCGTNLDPDAYKSNVTANAPKVSATRSTVRNPHMPYTDADLIKMFDPNHLFFQKNQDVFFTCLIGLFTGARSNAAATLQYDDVKEIDGIPCIEFVENHPIKALKTDASERIVPIHPQLLDIGFVEWVRKRQARLNAKGTDFIFPRCITSGGVYYEKFYRIFFDYLTDIGIKFKDGPKYDFHSFRNNLSNIMDAFNISPIIIDRVIGWKGTSVRAVHYSKRTLTDIRNEMNKYSYDFLDPVFKKWNRFVKK